MEKRPWDFRGLILEEPRPFFSQKPLKTAISATFIQENKKIFF